MRTSGLILAALMVCSEAAGAKDLTIKIPVPELPRVGVKSTALPPPPWAVPEGSKPAYNYKYYPDQEVYFDPARALYFLLQEGAWKGVPVLPPAVVLRNAPVVDLPMNDDKPYKHHDEVRKRHGKGLKRGHHKDDDDRGPPGHSKKKHDDDDGDGGKGHGKGKGKGKH